MTKNIIFDLGGVILNIDFQRTIDAFENIGIKDAGNFYSAFSQIGFFDDYDKGIITPEIFINKVKELSNSKLTDEDILNAWNSMVLDFPEENIRLIEKLKTKYRTFLLSNTNVIHYHFYHQQLRERFGYENLSDLFEKAYFSHISGYRKPDEKFFNLVLKENDLDENETLFIDDSPIHINAAKKLGLQTILMEPPKTLLSVMKDF